MKIIHRDVIIVAVKLLHLAVRCASSTRMIILHGIRLLIVDGVLWVALVPMIHTVERLLLGGGLVELRGLK